MFFSRLTAFVFFLVSLGLFASASPIMDTGLAVGDDSLAVRSAACSTFLDRGRYRRVLPLTLSLFP